MYRRTSLHRHAIATLCGAPMALLGAEPLPARAPDTARADDAACAQVAASVVPGRAARADGFIPGGGSQEASPAARTL